MRPILNVLVLVLLGLVAVESSAWAGPEDDRKAAEKLVSEGLTLARGKKFREAIPKFEEALRLYPHPEIQHNLARAHEELGDLKAAFELFTQALKQDYTYAADARTRLARIETELRKTHARLTVRTTPSQVQVALQFVDGKEETHVQAPFKTWVPAGATKVTGTNPNFKTKEETLELAAGEDRELQLTLVPLPREGFLLVKVNIAGATVSVAGQPIGKSPLESIAYEAGVYQLEVRAKGYKPFLSEVVIVQDEVTTANVSLEMDKAAGNGDESGGTPSWVGWTLVGTGAAASALALYMQFGKARPLQADANEAGADDALYNRLHRQAVQWQTAAIITGAVGIALVGTGTYLLLTQGSSDDTTSTTGFVPTLAVTPDGVGLGGLVRF